MRKCNCANNFHFNLGMQRTIHTARFILGVGSEPWKALNELDAVCLTPSFKKSIYS